MMTKIDLPSTAALLEPISLVQTGEDLLDIDAVCRFFGGTKPLHPATIYRGIDIRYPRPVRVSPNVNRWLRSECEAALKKILGAPREPLPSPKHRGKAA
jgi:predicted DNA-binding transcriptional regulator AlpA